MWALSLCSFVPYSLRIQNKESLEIINNYLVEYGVRYRINKEISISEDLTWMNNRYIDIIDIKPVTYRVVREQIIVQNWGKNDDNN